MRNEMTNGYWDFIKLIGKNRKENAWDTGYDGDIPGYREYDGNCFAMVVSSVKREVFGIHLGVVARSHLIQFFYRP